MCHLPATVDPVRAQIVEPDLPGGMKDPRGFFLLLPAEPDMRHFAGIMSVEKHKVTVGSQKGMLPIESRNTLAKALSSKAT